MKHSDGIEALFERELYSREANAEKFTCAIWIGLIATTYFLFVSASQSFSPELVKRITGLVSFMIPAFAAIFLLIHKGFYATWMRYLSTFLQVSLVSGAVFFDIRSHGAQYAFSSMPPMAYGLVVVVTAFRLRPLMGLFAGGIAAIEFALIYAWVARDASDFSPQLVERLPSLGWPVTGMKVLVLLSLGIACSFAAYRVRRQLSELVQEAVRQAKLKASLVRFVSPEVAQEIIETDEGRIATRRTEAVIMFGDIRGFTQFSSGRDPIDVVAVLNEVFETVNETVAEHGGVINKYLGDGFLAVFGLHGASGNPDRAAVEAAFELLKETRKRLEPHGLRMGIGLNRGEVIAGEIGSEDRCEFTVIGNAVNVASRIEGFNWELKTEFLVPESFLSHLEDCDLETRSLGIHSIRGIPNDVELIELRPGVECC